MLYEVECKYRIQDAPALRTRLDSLGAKFGPPIEQIDCYFAHPARDFARTDEALRIRREAGTACITYKGPKLDSTTKTRRELELPLPDFESAGGFSELLMALGFVQVSEVSKQRSYAELDRRGQTVAVAWDRVDRVGEYLELELSADEKGLDAAHQLLLELALILDPGPMERRSYLELLLLTE